MATAESEKKLEGEEGGKSDGAAASGGQLVYCGATQFDMIGRKMGPGSSNGYLVSPTRLRPLVGVNIRSVASGCGK
jgi:hypothetical protein